MGDFSIVSSSYRQY